jgi:SET domain-containing protein
MPSSVHDAPRLLKVSASGVHGRGVYAKEFIPAGTRIIEYTGRRIAWHETDDDESDPHTFIFGLEGGEVIDAAIGGNESRWINHSCGPNCEAIEEEGRVFIHAMRDIEPGEELSYDYALEIDEPITEKAKKEYACLCGSPNCRGTLLGL